MFVATPYVQPQELPTHDLQAPWGVYNLHGGYLNYICAQANADPEAGLVYEDVRKELDLAYEREIKSTSPTVLRASSLWLRLPPALKHSFAKWGLYYDAPCAVRLHV